MQTVCCYKPHSIILSYHTQLYYANTLNYVITTYIHFLYNTYIYRITKQTCLFYYKEHTMPNLFQKTHIKIIHLIWILTSTTEK